MRSGILGHVNRPKYLSSKAGTHLLYRLLVIAVLAISCPSAVTAQDEGFGGGEPAAPAAAAGDNASGSADDPGAEKPQNWLGWVYGALGLGYSIIFLALSFTLVALLVMNLLSARRDNVCPKELVDGFENKLNDKAYQDAYNLAKTDESFLGQVLSAGLEKLQSGYAQSIEAMQEVGEEENMKLEHRLSYIALIGTISPMIGLFGTVHGMIDSFQTIALAGTTPKASELAEGISTALFTTLLGLAIAIPAIAAYSILKNRTSQLSLEVGILSERLMSRFQNVGKKKEAVT